MVATGVSSAAYGQYYNYDNSYYDNDLVLELGGGVGGMNCLTDVSGTKSKGGLYINDFSMKNTLPNANLYVGFLYRGFVGVSLQATYGSIKAYDSIAKSVSGSPHQRYLGRNANFKSSIREIALLVEFHPLQLKFNSDGVSRWSPYLMVGLGWFSFNPQTSLNGVMVDLKPLRTEGQGFPEYKDRQPYRLSQANIPFGGGIRFELSPLFNLKAEFLHRVTFTDYIDDVSTTSIDPLLFDKYLSPLRASHAKAVYNLASMSAAPGNIRGYSKNNDSYMSLNLKIAMVLGRERK